MSNFGFDPLSPWLRFRPPPEDLPGFRVRPVDVLSDGVPGLANWRPPTTPTAQSAPDSAPPATEAASLPWWEQSTGPNTISGAGSESQWPWLRAPTDEVPSFRLNPDGSVRTDGQGGQVRLMAGAFAPFEPQEQPNDVAGGNGATSSNVVPSLSAGAQPSTTSAAAIAVPAALPASAGGAIDLAGLIARAAPVLADAVPSLAGLGSAALSSLPFLLIPTNTQSETTDLGDGLRARVRPGQKTVEIERRVDNGLLGTGFLAKWETLPVEAWQQMGRDGSVSTVINHEQLNRALGRSAPAEAKDGGASAMAQSPKDSEPQQLPPSAPGSGAEEVDKPGIGNPPATGSLAPTRTDAKALEETKQRDPEEEERLLACRAVRALPGQPAPPGQYGGPGGITTAVGIRVAPGFPSPKGGYGYSPNYLRHWNGYRGELELKNRIESAVPYEKFVHYGNPAGDQGPDVLTLGPDGRFMEWDSRSRMAMRRLGPSMAGSASLEPKDVKMYVWNAIRSRAITPDAGDRALQELKDGNYNVCTVGTGNAYDGYFESVRNGTSTGPRR